MSFDKQFGGDFLAQVAKGVTSTPNLKDYSHASKLMRPNGLALAPNQKFLFHVSFNLTDPSIMQSYTNNDNGLIGALVKTVQLPSFTLDTEEYIQYNRKRLVHNRIKYEPVQLTMHDDASDVVRQLWNQYYTYYFADSKYEYTSGVPGDSTAGKVDYNSRDIYNTTRPEPQAGWGKSIINPGGGDTKPAFFKDITIYGMSRGQFRSYTLVNPVITAWRHDQYDYSQSDGIMQHDISIQYETVKYGTGDVDDIPTFGKESRYDTESGALGPGSTASLFGPGGVKAGGQSILTDLASGNVLGALKTAGTISSTFAGKDVGALLSQDLSADLLTRGLSTLGKTVRGANKFLKKEVSGQSDTSSSPTTEKPIE